MSHPVPSSGPRLSSSLISIKSLISAAFWLVIMASSPSKASRRRPELAFYRQILIKLETMVGLPLLIISALAIGLILVYMRTVLLPFVIALFLSYLLRPLCDWITRAWDEHVCCRRCFRSRRENGDLYQTLEGRDGVQMRRRERRIVCWKCRVCSVPRWVAVIVAMLILFSVIGGISLMIADGVQHFIDQDYDDYKENAIRMARKVSAWIQKVFGLNSSSLEQMIDDFEHSIQTTGLISDVVFELFDLLGTAFLSVLFLVYLLFEVREQPRGSMRMQIDQQIQRYLGLKTLISASVGILVWIVLGPVLDVKMAHLWAVLTFGANYLPNVGPLIATFLPFPIIILDPGLGTSSKLLAFAIPIAIHFVVGNFIEPLVFGKSLELHPIVVLLALSFWYSMWGVPGAVLSVPIVAVMRIIASFIDHPFAEVAASLLGGKITSPTAQGTHLGYIPPSEEEDDIDTLFGHHEAKISKDHSGLLFPIMNESMNVHGRSKSYVGGSSWRSGDTPTEATALLPPPKIRLPARRDEEEEEGAVEMSRTSQDGKDHSGEDSPADGAGKKE